MASRIAIAGAQGVIGILLLIGIWAGLPARWWPVDLLGTALALGALGSAVAVIATHGRPSHPRAMQFVRIVLWAELVLGTLTVSLLATSMAHLSGSYGPVGSGGALLMGAIFVLVLPYLVALPAIQLHALGRAGRAGPPNGVA
ncbi:MAG TPA: hypothetical protein VFG30_26540 [Polyangiales bacterium]|nr:hypothetical protein [Polyangiales bacterium]